MGTALTIAIIVLLVGFGIFIAKKSEAKRTSKLTEFFRGLSFQKIEQTVIPDFKITSRGYYEKRYNNFEGRVIGFDLSVFDYRFTVGSGKHQHTYNMTIAMTDANLPVFQLSKEGLLQKFADKFTRKDIDFQDYPEFSDKYVLHGDVEQEVRRVFTPEVLRFFENNQIFCSKSNGRQLILYKPYKRIKPEQMNELLETVKSCFQLFGKSA